MAARTPAEVALRDVTDDDLPMFFENQRDPEATRMAEFPALEWDAFAAHWKRIRADDDIAKKTILFRGHVAGNIVSWTQSGNREVGYWLGREYWGKGVATRALSAFLGLVPTRPLFAHVAKRNVASIKVLEKCGFQLSGEDTGSGAHGTRVEEVILRLDEVDSPPTRASRGEDGDHFTR